MKYTAYDPATGLIAFTGDCHDGMIDLQGAPGLSVVEGHYHWDEFYWDGTAMVAVPSPKPAAFYRFDRATLSWIGDSDAASAFVRTKRDALLAASDWTQMPDVPADTQTLWQPYRQSLRDVTAQDGFPFNVEWPTPPA